MFSPEDDDPAFAGQVTNSRVTSGDPMDRTLGPDPMDISVAPRHNLDAPHNSRLFDNLMSHYRRELARQYDNRMEQEKDEDFYDNEQWEAEDKAALEDRGQSPMTFNVIATTINWMLGSEKRSRTDYKILPRKKDGLKSAERKTQLMKYLSDVNKSPFAWSRGFADTTKVGVGWIESGVQDETEGEPVYDRMESWRNIIYDSLATELDLSDGRYEFRTRWTDLDIAYSLFPDRRHLIREGANTSYDLMRSLDGAGDYPMDAMEEEWAQASLSTVYGTTSHARQRVRLIEGWFRVPIHDSFMSGGQFAGEVFDPNSPGHMRELERGFATLVKKVRMRMHVAIFCEAGLLYLAPSPYRHNQFPFTPIWCYRRGRDGMAYGLVRGMRDPQSDINKRASKALHILNSNKVIMDEGAVADLDEFAEEVARPDAIIVKKPGKELTLDADRGMETAHLELMSRSIAMIQSITGVTDENMGRTTNATSGKAIIARQDQGSLATATIFDNLRFAKQVHGAKMLSLMEQFMTQQKEFRITNMRGNPEYVSINDGLPENDIVRTKADFIISEEDFNSTIRQAQVAELMQLMQNLASASPQIVMATLDLVVETMDVPQRDELVKRIRQITGMADPDADPNHPDPQEQARQQQQQQEQALKQRMQVAQVAKVEADAEQKKAQAGKHGAEQAKLIAQIRQVLAATANENVNTQVQALQAAAQIMAATSISPVADTVLHEAAFDPRQNIAGDTGPQGPGPQLPQPTHPAPNQLPPQMQPRPHPGLPPQMQHRPGFQPTPQPQQENQAA